MEAEIISDANFKSKYLFSYNQSIIVTNEIEKEFPVLHRKLIPELKKIDHTFESLIQEAKFKKIINQNNDNIIDDLYCLMKIAPKNPERLEKFNELHYLLRFLMKNKLKQTKDCEIFEKSNKNQTSLLGHKRKLDVLYEVNEDNNFPSLHLKNDKKEEEAILKSAGTILSSELSSLDFTKNTNTNINQINTISSKQNNLKVTEDKDAKSEEKPEKIDFKSGKVSKTKKKSKSKIKENNVKFKAIISKNINSNLKNLDNENNNDLKLVHSHDVKVKVEEKDNLMIKTNKFDLKDIFFTSKISKSKSNPPVNISKIINKEEERLKQAKELLKKSSSITKISIDLIKLVDSDKKDKFIKMIELYNNKKTLNDTKINFEKTCFITTSTKALEIGFKSDFVWQAAIKNL